MPITTADNSYFLNNNPNQQCQVENDNFNAEEELKRCYDYISNFWEKEYSKIASQTPYPLWFPHQLDLANWHNHLNCHFLERGIYTHQIIRFDDEVLDLCCGDGFYPKFFYAIKAKSIDAVDLNEQALSYALQYNDHPKIIYYIGDIVKEPFPKDRYDVVAWDSAIRRLSIESINIVLDKIVNVLEPGYGRFSAYEIFEDDNCQIDFITPLTFEMLYDMLKARFPKVNYIETHTPDRHNYYFNCFL